MRAEIVQSVVVIGVSGIDQNVDQQLLIQKMLLRKFDVKHIAENLPGFFLVPVMEERRNGIVLQNLLRHFIFVFPDGLPTGFRQPVIKLFAGGVGIAELFQCRIVQFIPVIRIDFRVEPTVSVPEADPVQNLFRRFSECVFLFHLLSLSFSVGHKKGLTGNRRMNAVPVKSADRK